MSGKVWEDIKKGLEDSITFATEKTKELTSVGKLKITISGINKKIDRKFRELGKHVFLLMDDDKGGNLAKDSIANGIIAELKELDNELKEKEAELIEVRKREEKSQEETVESTDEIEASSETK